MARRWRVRAALLAVPLTVLGGLLVPQQAHAHCPSGFEYLYVAGLQGSETYRSVRVRAEWLPSPAVCDSRTYYSASIVKGDNDGWLQVGWVYEKGYSRPLGYCERQPTANGTGSYALTEFRVSESEQLYTYDREGADGGWFYCRIGGEALLITSSEYMGFTYGGHIVVQAEAHARHLQLGRIAPDWFRFSDSEKIPTGASNWSQLNIEGVHSDAEVWDWSQPYNDGFKVRTDANH